MLAERGELNQLELSKRVGMASTTAVPALDSMEKRGLLKRRRDPKDRRKYYVVLTEKGAAFGRQAVAENRQHDGQSLHGITWEETRIFWRVANHIAKNLAEMAGDDLVLD